MDWRLNWSPSAREDLKEIYLTIAADKPAAASDFLHETLDAVELLRGHRFLGRMVPEFGDELIRELIRSPYRLVYQIHEDEGVVEVIRVWHAARGAPRL